MAAKTICSTAGNLKLAPLNSLTGRRCPMVIDPVTESLLSLRGTQQDRQNRYALNWLYYRAHEYMGDLGQRYAKEHQLFKAMRHVFGYVTQCVDTDARFVMKKRLSVESDPEFEEDILAVWERSNFQTEKYKLVRFGSNLGDAYLIVQDIGDGNRVVPRIIVANSEDMDVQKDPDDQNEVIQATQEYGFYDSEGRPRRRKWVYTPDAVERYTDDKLDEGYPRPHPFGEAPVVHIKAIDIGEEYGLHSWHNCQTQFDEVNELGSFSNRILLRYADPTLIGIGMTSKDKPVFYKGINRDNIYLLASAEADLKILEYQGNVLTQVLEQIREIAANIKDQLPELSLSKIREQSGLSGYAVSLHASELIAKVEEMRGNFGNGIEWANSLALRAIRRSSAPLEEFKNNIVYEPILPEDKEGTLRTWQIESDLGILSRREMLRRDGLSEEEIDKRLQEVEDDRGAQGFGLSRLDALLAASGLGNNDDDGDDASGEEEDE